jgi:antitoxin MazE
MKLATTAKLPKKTSAKVNDPDNPAWTENMLGAPVIKRGRGPQAASTKILTTVRLDADSLENIIEPYEKVKYKLEDLVAGMTEKNRHDEVSFGKPVGKEAL